MTLILSRRVALIPRRQHAAVVLLGREDFVAGLEVDAVLRDLQRLARVARDGELFLVAAEFGRQPAARRFLVLFELAAVIAPAPDSRNRDSA